MVGSVVEKVAVLFRKGAQVVSGERQSVDKKMAAAGPPVPPM